MARYRDPCRVARARRYGTALSAIIFDIDHFKRVNDTLGQDAGDLVLRELGEGTRAIVRDVDFAGRLGGEEFAWLLPSTNLAAAHIASDRVRTRINSRPFGNAIHMTASFGVNEPGIKGKYLDLLKGADANL